MAVFHYVHLRAFAHETEDPDKVRHAMRQTLGVDALALDETRVEGTHKNRILILEAEVRSAPAAKRVFGALARDHPEAFAALDAEIPRRLDEHLNFHLRLDKQAAYEGRVRLADADDAITLRAKLRSFASRRSGQGQDEAVEQLRAFLQGMRPLRSED